MAVKLELPKNEITNCRESMERMTCTFMEQFLELAKSHLESTILVSHETGLRVGLTVREGCLLGNFESPYPLALNFKLKLIYLTLRVRKRSLHLSFHMHLSLRLAFLWTLLRMLQISMTPLFLQLS